ncbi:related to sexual differentiation process protein isp4 [Cephalotrichum gorgonifer]|uniref:Related to sexual differentiation process protein isp4 n=1 Tax=Cephalotrichum gorgonifer TaxID=2041049 RepID=A0AAE8N3K8_9PEZI|nr:related to sexual differentiation process protein isp4 [Cephalotrichum gorgonifer]
MAEDPEKSAWDPVAPRRREVQDEKTQDTPQVEEPETPREPDTRGAYDEVDLCATGDDLLHVKELADQYTLEEVKLLMQRIHKVHKHDPNFPFSVIKKIEEFLGMHHASGQGQELQANRSDVTVLAQPEKHRALIQELKLEAALITNNSPYAEVRAVAENDDDPDTPCSTIRAWAIGILFAIPISFVNQLFSITYPSLFVLSNVVQLLAWPVGKLCELALPDVGVTVFDVRHSLNPGVFSKKEHMLITIMANVAYNPPYTAYTMWMQYLPHYFNQPWAAQFGYQILVALSTNFIGYGVAGVCRRFIVYPSYCIWPTTLVTLALNSALHKQDKNPAVRGPGLSVWRSSRRAFFYASFLAMKLWYWLPAFLWTSLSNFSWMTWISPMNRDLSTITGFNSGLGVNPWPTFDWETLHWDGSDPLVIPWFCTLNKFIGAVGSMGIILGLWYSNAYNTGYLPINSNGIYDNMAMRYSAFLVVGEDRLFNKEGYDGYSAPYITAGNIVLFMSFFAVYTATLTYAALYYGDEIARGVRSLVSSALRRQNDGDESIPVVDVHNRLMRRYTEVPEWWYLAILLPAAALGIAGIAAFDTYTSPGVVFYGLALCVIFVVPVGIIKATTGIEVVLNVLAELMGGAFVDGNALSMNYFKTFGYVTTAKAIQFSGNLKLGHYAKVPPRQGFCAQIAAALVSTFVCTGVLSYQMKHVEGVCTPEAEMSMYCQNIDSLFTSTVFWGSVGPGRLWGPGGMYTETLVGFPLGVLAVVACWWLGRVERVRGWMRGVHPVALVYGGLSWAPYNMSYVWPAVPVGWLSWVYLRRRFLAMWSKYNYVLSAAFSCGIAITGIIVFFAVRWEVSREVVWWGNTVNSQGCEANPCVLKTLEDFDYFGPRVEVPELDISDFPEDFPEDI